MQCNSKLLDYSCLSGIRLYRPSIGVDPTDVDPLAGASRTCRDCSAPLREVAEVNESSSGDPAAILICDTCGWWCQYAIGANKDGFFECERVPAALRTYDVSNIVAPVTALRRALSENPKWLDELNPTKMEELVGSILSDFMDCEVVHTGRTGDGGIDLLLLDGDTSYVVQVKRRISQHGETVSAVREFLGATLLAGYRRGIYVTTATHYTPATVDAAAAAKSRRLLEKLHLIDRDRFLRLLRLVSAKTLHPWQAYYRDIEGEDINNSFRVRFHGENDPCEWVQYDESGNEFIVFPR